MNNDFIYKRKEYRIKEKTEDIPQKNTQLYLDDFAVKLEKMSNENEIF